VGKSNERRTGENSFGITSAESAWNHTSRLGTVFKQRCNDVEE
jgi:hypothetical protein